MLGVLFATLFAIATSDEPSAQISICAYYNGDSGATSNAVSGWAYIELYEAGECTIPDDYDYWTYAGVEVSTPWGNWDSDSQTGSWYAEASASASLQSGESGYAYAYLEVGVCVILGPIACDGDDDEDTFYIEPPPPQPTLELYASDYNPPFNSGWVQVWAVIENGSAEGIGWYGCQPDQYYSQVCWVNTDVAGSHYVEAWITGAGDSLEIQVQPPPPQCGDERGNIIAEYVSHGVNWTPTCDDFSTGGGTANFSWPELNRSPGSGHPPYGIVRSVLWTGLEDTRSSYNRGGIIIDSGYRCPHGNALVGGVAQSRHMWGDAADMHSAEHPWDFSEWNLLQQAAVAAGATFIEPYSQDPSHVHADWR
jgi:Peptidase M15